MSAYKRVLLKLSGESLGGPAGKGIDENWLAAYAEEVAQAVRNGLQVAIVIGGGNIFRGLQGVGKGFDRVNGDKMGMLATVINSLGLAMAIRSAGVDAEVFTATPMMPVARYYMRDDAVAVQVILTSQQIPVRLSVLWKLVQMPFLREHALMECTLLIPRRILRQ